MTDILQSSGCRSMLLCIFVTYKAKAVLFLSRAVLLCMFHFPRKGFWHNVVLIKGDFCSILFRFLCAFCVFSFFFFFFYYTMQGQRQERGIIWGWVFLIHIFFPWAHSRTGNNFFSTHSTISWNPAGLCRTHLSSCPLGRHWGLPHLIWCFFFFVFSFLNGEKKICPISWGGVSLSIPFITQLNSTVLVLEVRGLPLPSLSSPGGEREVIWDV